MWKGESQFYISCLLVPTVILLTLMGVFSVANLEARVSTCEARLTECGIALGTYAGEHNGHYPRSGVRRSTLKPYLGSHTPFSCEITDRPLEYHRPPANAPQDFVVLRCREHRVGLFRRRVDLELWYDGTVHRR